jgi:hypothetical protein
MRKLVIAFTMTLACAGVAKAMEPPTLTDILPDTLSKITTMGRITGDSCWSQTIGDTLVFAGLKAVIDTCQYWSNQMTPAYPTLAGDSDVVTVQLNRRQLRWLIEFIEAGMAPQPKYGTIQAIADGAR